MPPDRIVTTRVVGTCAYCSGSVILKVKFGGVRDASCGCGATVIPPSFFARAVAQIVGPLRGESKC